MPLELFIPKTFRHSSRVVIRQANRLIAEYQKHGFILTVRQLYYRMVTEEFIPNTMKDYKRFKQIINDARLAGLIDWEMIEDRTRNLMSYTNFKDPVEFLQLHTFGYVQDIWRDQAIRPEVWVEKDALTGVIEPACNYFRVPYFACRGYTSQSEQWRAGHRFKNYLKSGCRVLIIHLGDHDPSGIDMSRDNTDRLAMFARSNHVEVRRIALNKDQVEEYNLAPNPAKETDSRFKNYADEHGESSWELDALDPMVIDAMIRAEIEPLIDNTLWNRVLAEEQTSRR